MTNAELQAEPLKRTPGDLIKEELVKHGWTQADLAAVLDRPLPVVNAIACGRTGITPKTAVGLGAAFGTSAEFWLKKESAYRLRIYLARERRNDQRGSTS